MVTPSELTNLVQSYWDGHMWDGIQTAEDCPRTREFTETYLQTSTAVRLGVEPDLSTVPTDA
jgi:hypothetical protein